jgi:acetylglutamate kinase
MVPKLDNAFAALDAGVATVRIGHAHELALLLKGQSGTTITHG